MHAFDYFPLFLIGLLGGGTHCAGMCGGIVGALSLGGKSRPVLHLAYNAGRIFSYTIAGAIVGALGNAGMVFSGVLPASIIPFVIANLVLVAIGLYLMGATRTLTFLEIIGQHLWRRIHPLTRHCLPARTWGQVFSLGLLWGWLPCGLVYGALATALGSGSAWRGAGMMLAFGLGTLPTLLLAGMLAIRLNDYLARPVVRFPAGLIILAFGLWGIYQLLGFTSHHH